MLPLPLGPKDEGTEARNSPQAGVSVAASPLPHAGAGPYLSLGLPAQSLALVTRAPAPCPGRDSLALMPSPKSAFLAPCPLPAWLNLALRHTSPPRHPPIPPAGPSPVLHPRVGIWVPWPEPCHRPGTGDFHTHPACRVTWGKSLHFPLREHRRSRPGQMFSEQVCCGGCLLSHCPPTNRQAFYFHAKKSKYLDNFF